MYWSIRGIGQEADAWTDRILDVVTGAGQDTPAETSAGSLWLFASLHQANRQRDSGQLERAEHSYQKVLNYLQDQPETKWTRKQIAGMHYQLGSAAQHRGRLDEATTGTEKPSCSSKS